METVGPNNKPWPLKRAQLVALHSSSSSTHKEEEQTQAMNIGKSYGSIGSDFLEPNLSGPTTASPDDTKGLYLLWTDQMLRENGHVPYELEEGLSNDSSVSGDEDEPRRIFFSPSILSSHHEPPFFSYQNSLMSHSQQLTDPLPSQDSLPQHGSFHFLAWFRTCFS